MRVTFAIPAWPPARGYGGPVEVLRLLLPALRARGIAPHVLTTTATAVDTANCTPGTRQEDGVAVTRLPLAVRRDWSVWPRRWPPAEDADLVHVFGAWNGLSYAALLAARRQGIATVWEPSGMLTVAGPRRRAKAALTRLHVTLVRGSAGATLLYTSPQEREEAPASLRDARNVLRANPVADDATARAAATLTRRQARERLGLDTAGPLWGYLGRLDPRKGLRELLRAWRAAAGPGTLAIAGPAQNRELHEELTAAARHPSVRLLGAMSGEQRWTFLRALDALVLVPRYGENFGLVVGEAVTVGTPALVSPAVGAAHWLSGQRQSCTVVNDAALVHRFASAGPPAAVPPGVPAALDVARVAESLVAIYGRVHARWYADRA